MRNDKTESTDRGNPETGRPAPTALGNGALLIRQSMALFKAEMREKITTVVVLAGMVGAGAGLFAAGGLALVAALIVWLTAFLPLWAAALLTGIALTGVGGGLALLGILLLRRSVIIPRKSMDMLRENIRWLTELL